MERTACPQYPGSSYVDNAEYYLGRSWFNLGVAATAPSDAINDFQSAATAFEGVLAITGSVFADGADYYLGRSHYELGLLVVAPNDVTELQAAVAALSAFDSTYAASPYVDGAETYLGKSHYRLAKSSATPEVEYSAALAAFAKVAPTSAFEDQALYFAGRSHYELALLAPPDATNLNAAAVDFSTVASSYAASAYADNALRWAVATYIGLARCADAAAALSALVNTYPSSNEIALAQADWDAAVVAGVCP